MCEVGGERTLKWRKLVVGDEAPYLVLVRLAGENTITTGVKFLLCEKRKLNDGRPKRERRPDSGRETATPTETRRPRTATAKNFFYRTVDPLRL